MQQRLVLLSRDMENQNGQRIPYQPAFTGRSYQIEERRKLNRPWKTVTVRRGLKEDPDAALDRDFAAHPEDRDANVVIYNFFSEG